MSKNAVRLAILIVSGVTTNVTSAAIAKAAADVSSSDIRGRRRDRDQRLLARSLVLDHGVDRVVHGAARLPARQLAQGGGVRPADPEFVEAVAIRLLVGHED